MIEARGAVPEKSPELNLTEFVDAHGDQRPAASLSTKGRFSANILAAIGNETTTSALLATNFWRAWLASEGAERVLRDHGASSGLAGCQTIIVPRSNLSRYDLVVLDPGLPAESRPVWIDVSKTSHESALQFGAHRSMTQDRLRYIWTDAPRVTLESFAGGKQPYCVVLASRPRSERLAVPGGALDVDSAATGQHSTAGVVVEDLTRPGRIGVTAALHGVGPLAQTVTVAGQSGSIVRTSPVTDSAFVELSAAPSCVMTPANGVMSGMAPRGSQSASFVGLTSRNRTTTIVGWDPDVPSPSGFRQACIYTGRDAQPGDSGSALVSDDDWIVGFAFERSRPGRNPVQCSWIWAESVMAALQVKLI
jgi:hypothetical protein